MLWWIMETLMICCQFSSTCSNHNKGNGIKCCSFNWSTFYRIKKNEYHAIYFSSKHSIQCNHYLSLQIPNSWYDYLKISMHILLIFFFPNLKCKLWWANIDMVFPKRVQSDFSLFKSNSYNDYPISLMLRIIQDKHILTSF